MLTIIPSQQQTNNEETSRVFWIVVLSLSAVYLAAIFVLGPFSAVWHGVQPYAELMVQYPSLIRFSTFFLCAGCTWFLFWPREGSRFVGRWSDCVALAFATFALQYFLRFAELKLEAVLNPTLQSAFHHAASLVVYACSSLNNLLFLAAARILQNKNRKIQQLYPLDENPRILYQLKKKLLNAVVEFKGTLPGWALVAAIVGPIALLDSWPRFFWARFPDAIFSLTCLSWFGYAVAVNLNENRRRILAVIAMLIAVTYGGAQLVYATNPIIAYSATAGRSRSPVIQWVKSNVGIAANSLAVQTNEKTGRKDSTIIFLDNAVYALLLPLKLALFLPAFSLYLLFVISSLSDFRPALFDSLRRRQDFLSSDGILRALGKAIGAKKVALYIRLPGTHESENGREERALPLVWNSNGEREKPEPIWIDAHPHLKRIMKDEGLELLDSDVVDGTMTTNGDGTDPDHPWFVPVKFHDGIIGAVQADVKGLRRNNTALQKIRLVSELIGPSVQDYRAIAALDQMGFRFTRLQVDHRTESFSDATKIMTFVMHDVLSPLASALIIEIGFNSIHHFHAGDNADKQLLKDEQNDSWLEHEGSRLIGRDQNIRLDINQIVVRSRQHQDGRKPLQIGGLVSTIPNERDDFALPTLAAYYLNRKAVASIVADGVFDVARGFFSEIIKDMGLEFSTEPLSDKAWFETVEAAVKRSGIRWAVAQPFKNDTYGEGSDRIKLHPNLSDSDRAALFSQRLVTPGAESFRTPRVVEISLRRSNRRLWLGIERENFGPELDFDSPWRIFLDDLADVADAALDSMQKKREAELAREDQEVIAIAVMTGTLTHQLFNLLGSQVQSTEFMEKEPARNPAIKLTDTYKNHFRNLRTSALNGRELTEAFSRITEGDKSTTCDINEAAHEAVKLHRMLLRKRNIIVNVDPSTNIVARVPFFRAAFALANLVGNASDAINYEGTIDIRVEETDEFIVCHVTNDGPAVREEIRERLFEIGVTDKPRHSHRGWGLYYVRRLLAQIGGKVELACSEDKNVRFTLSFPKDSA